MEAAAGAAAVAVASEGAAAGGGPIPPVTPPAGPSLESSLFMVALLLPAVQECVGRVWEVGISGRCASGRSLHMVALLLLVDDENGRCDCKACGSGRWR